MIIERRALLRGLFAAPAIVAVGSLMPLRGVKLITPHMIVDELVEEYLAEMRQSSIGYHFKYKEPPPLRLIIIESERYRATIDRMIEHVAHSMYNIESRLRG